MTGLTKEEKRKIFKETKGVGKKIFPGLTVSELRSVEEVEVEIEELPKCREIEVGGKKIAICLDETGKKIKLYQIKGE